jgi:type I restriction enzyme S subunit
MKPGYKLTEVGVIPEDWGAPQIESIIEEISMGPFGSDITISNFVSSGVPVLNGVNVAQERLIDEFQNFLTPAKARSLKKAIAHRGDVVVTHRGTIGQIAYIPDDSAFDEYVISQSQFRIRFSNQVRPDWAVRYFHSENGSKKLLEGKGHTGVPAIAQPTTTFRKLFIPLPSLPEQFAIATALSDMDALLDGLDRLIAKKRAIKQAAMQQLLTGQTRLPGFSGEWEMKRLGDIGKCLRGVSYHGDTDLLPYDTEKTKRLLRSNNIQDTIIIKNDVQFVDSACVSECQILREGDVLICMANGSKALVGKTGYFTVSDGFEYTFGAFMGAFRATHEFVNHRFTSYVFQTWVYRQYIANVLAGSSINNLTPSSIESLEFKFPTVEEQTAIAQVLTDMDAEITALETRRAKTHALKQAMMQELLTGRTRLTSSMVKPQSNVIDISTAKNKGKPHNWQINEAVVISILASRFGSERYPLGRKRCTKLTYLMHRHVEHIAEGYLKKAAGPYNPDVKYRGPEGIAQKNGYIRQHKSGNFFGFVAADNIAEAQNYFMEWYGQEVLDWLEQFRTKTNDELELLTTVDMSVVELEKSGFAANLEGVKTVITAHPEWEAKLERQIFSDFNIRRAICSVRELFAGQE